MKKLFGTDGIRGRANSHPITCEILTKVALMAGNLAKTGNHRHRVVIGKDTRLSGYMLEPALVGGFISAGMDVVLVGPIPTPGLAMLTQSMRADLGVMISASHNPYCDNGIKIFGADGYKISEQMERAIEQGVFGGEYQYSNAEDLGRAKRLDDAQGRYIEFAKSTLPKHIRLDGLKIVIDCANGAAYDVAPKILYELGADVVAINNEPNGTNINEGCGAVEPEKMRIRTMREHAHIGIALDGDADRVILSDNKGHLIDGDKILGIIARDWHENGLLQGAVIGTVMSNYGLEKFINSLGVQFVRTNVGDKFITEQMMAGVGNIGAEQSGHVVMKNYGTTGDGLIAALQVLAVMISKGKSLYELSQIYQPTPQFLDKVVFAEMAKANEVLQSNEYKIFLEKITNKFAPHGRILVRKSGTEPAIRILAEGTNAELNKEVVNEIKTIIKQYM